MTSIYHHSEFAFNIFALHWPLVIPAGLLIICATIQFEWSKALLLTIVITLLESLILIDQHGQYVGYSAYFIVPTVMPVIMLITFGIGLLLKFLIKRWWRQFWIG